MQPCPHTNLTRPECHCQACAREMIATFAPHLAQGRGASADDATEGVLVRAR